MTQLLEREQAAAYSGFLVKTFDAWVRRGLLPSATAEGHWHQAELSGALEQLARDGHQDAFIPARKIPRVHRPKR